MSDFVDQVERLGFAIVPTFLDEGSLGALERALPPSVDDSAGLRNLLDVPAIAALAESTAARALIELLLGPNAFPVRGILFDKTPMANWKVSWHQDLTVAVKHQVETPGYGPWNEKAGVMHVQPPADVLERMLAVRVHLDESGDKNGPLRVLPGSHSAGKLRDAEILSWPSRVREQSCLVPRGGAVLMRPLLLHASSPASSPGHRRVLHLEYAGCELAAGLEWRWATRRDRAA